MVIVLISVTCSGAVLIKRGDAYQREELISVWIPKGAELIRGPALTRGNTISIAVN